MIESLWSKYGADIQYYGKEHLAFCHNADNIEDLLTYLKDFRNFLNTKIKEIENEV